MRLRLILAFMIMALLMGAGVNTRAQTGEPVLKIQEVTSPGGIKAWLVEDHSIPVIALEFGFHGAGAINDADDKQGTAQLLSNTLDEGAGDMNALAFQKTLFDLSAQLSFAADRDHFTGSLKTLRENSDQSFGLLALALTKPRFDAEAVGRMRKANQSRIRSDMTDPQWIAARLINNVAYAGQKYARNSGGTLSSLEKITPADLREFHATHLGRSNLMIGVAGDITAAELAQKLDLIFGGLPQSAKTANASKFEVQNPGTITLYKKDMPQTVIEIMQPGIDRRDPRYHRAQVMNFIFGSSGFGSRLTREVREKRGLTYGIYSALTSLDYSSGLSISTSTKNESVPQVIALIREEMEKMMTTPVSALEVENARNYLIGSLPLSLTSTNKIAGLLLSLQLDGMGIDYLEQRQNAIMATTPADVQAIAREILRPESLSVVMVGQPADVTPTSVVEKLPDVE